MVEDEGEDWSVEADQADSMALASNVQRQRKVLGMSQTELAAAMVKAGRTHWRQNTVSRVETGKQELSFGDLRALQGILGPITEGMPSMERATKAAGALKDVILSRKLQAVQAQLESALADVRKLRTVFDDSYEPSNEELERF